MKALWKKRAPARRRSVVAAGLAVSAVLSVLVIEPVSVSATPPPDAPAPPDTPPPDTPPPDTAAPPTVTTAPPDTTPEPTEPSTTVAAPTTLAPEPTTTPAPSTVPSSEPEAPTDTTLPEDTVPEDTTPAESTTTTSVPDGPQPITVGPSPFAVGADVVSGLPGTPQPPNVVWHEDFEAPQGTSPISVADYAGADGTRYAASGADPATCAGLVLGFGDAAPSDACDWSGFQTLTDALGQWGGSAAPQTNHAVTSLGGIATESVIPVVPGHVYTIAVDTAFAGCSVAQPKVELRVGGTAVSAAPIDLCAAPDLVAGDVVMRTAVGDAPVLMTDDSTSVSVGIVDAAGAIGALDNVRLIDVTPQLDTELEVAEVVDIPEEQTESGATAEADTEADGAVGTTAELTFTVTNTLELAAKPAFSFTTNLPDGLVIADDPAVAGDCAGADVVAEPGSSTIELAGELQDGVASCEVTLAVASVDAGAYALGADDLDDLVGVRPPAGAAAADDMVIAAAADIGIFAVPAWECSADSPALLFQGGQIYRINLAGEEFPITPTTMRVNAVGLNIIDGAVYGWSPPNDQVARVGVDGSGELLGVPAGMTAADIADGFVIGDVDDNGHLWLLSGDDRWYQIDAITNTLLASGTAPLGDEYTSGADWVYLPGTNALWRVVSNGGASWLTSFDRTSHTWTTPTFLGDLGGPGSNNNTGAVFADPNGFIYASYNNTGEIWRIHVASSTAARFAYGPSSTGNDGARCPSPVFTDFGDAPAPYPTTLAADGPRHGIPGYDPASGTASLMLGSRIDSEADGIPTAAADGDDTSQVDDEDGPAAAISGLPGQPITTRVTVTNNSGGNATVAAWLDRDGNGAFDDGPPTTIVVGPGTFPYDITLPSVTAASGQTYARFRAFPANTPAERIAPVGLAAGGEVEDHQVRIASTTFDKQLDDVVANGDGTYDVVYRLTVSQTGAADTYTLTDTFTFGAGATVSGPPVVSAPGVTLNPGFNGTTDTTIASDVPIAGGATHQYLVTATVRLDPATMTFQSSDCTMQDGESGTGLRNEATITSTGGRLSDAACEAMPGSPTVAKSVTSGPTAVGGGVYEVVYTLAVSNASSTAGTYDLADTLRFGSPVTVTSATVAAVTGGITPNPAWNGRTTTGIVTNQAIAPGSAAGPAVHTYRVTVRFTVNADAVTFANSDCSLTTGETGTGLLNSSSVGVNGATSSDTDCRPIPGSPTVAKSVTSGPTAVGGGVYEVVYTLAVSNASSTAGTYDLADTLRFGSPVTVTSATVAAVTGGITPNPAWNGRTTTGIVTNQPIAPASAAGSAVHVYTVTVRFTVNADAVTFANSDCSLTTGETGTGLLNSSSVGVNGATSSDTDCRPIPGTPTVAKTAAAPTAVGGGAYQVVYTLRVSNPSSVSGSYDLSDTLRFGSPVTVTSATVAAPTGITPNPAWNGRTTTGIVTNQPIAPASAAGSAVHVYTVTVRFTVNADAVTFANSDCGLTTGESGTGLLNSSSVGVNGATSSDTDCRPIPAVPTHTKTAGAPTAVGGGVYQVVYTLEVSNRSAGTGAYDLADTLRFGPAVTVASATVTNSTPGGITTNPAWNGRTTTAIVNDQAIAAGAAGGPTIHRYVVTVRFTVNADAVTFANSDCSLTTGETGTGLLNASSMDVNGSDADDSACQPLPASPTHTKAVTSGPTALGGGAYQMVYTLTVSNAGSTAGAYDLSDTLRFGGAVTVTSATVTNSTPGGITTNPAWNGRTTTAIVNDQAIAAGAAGGPTIHRYVVTVRFTVNADAVTFANSDCSLTTGETGTGLLNASGIDVNGADDDATACQPLPASPTHTKAVTSGPTAVGGGVYEMVYTLTVSNAAPSAGTYDLADTLRFGSPVTVTSATVANTAPGNITTNPAWNGRATTAIVNDQAIGAGSAAGPAVHTYRVTVRFTVNADAVTFANSDCSLTTGETGTGLMNASGIDVNGADDDATACQPLPASPVHTKAVTSGPTALGGGVYEMVYTLTVSNAAPSAGAYDLADTLRFGSPVTVTSATVANTAPGGITTNPAWNGRATTAIVNDQAIGAGSAAGPAVHTYRVTVRFTVNADAVTFANSDCSLTTGETGTGLLNSSAVDVNDVDDPATACQPLPGSPTHTKTVTSGPTAEGDGVYEVVYTITVSNRSAGAGTYDLADTLRFGAPVTVTGTNVTATPASVTPNAAWNGRTTTAIVNDQAIAAGTAGGPAVHTYTVTVRFTVDADAVTFANSDCSLTTGENGTGLLNSSGIDVNEADDAATACQPLPASPVHTKTVTSGPTAQGGGVYEMVYTLTVSNAAPSAGTYDLSDSLQFGAPVTVTSATVANTAPGNITPNAAWNGRTTTAIVTDQAIGAGAASGPAVHTYTVTVLFTVDAHAVTYANSDCTRSTGESGSGLLNGSAIDVNDVDDPATACQPLPGSPVHTKAVSAGPTPVGGGVYEVVYTLTVSNASAGAGVYDLADTLQLGDPVTVTSATVANTAPGTVVTDPAWNGVSSPTIVTDQAIGAGSASGPAVHTYDVTVQFEVDLASVTFENSDCTIADGESGSGLFNSSTIGVNEVDDGEDACEPLPAAPTQVKEVSSEPAPLGGGVYEVGYTITVSNPSAGSGAYDLADALQYGEPMTIVEAIVENAAPGSIVTNPVWDGVTDSVIVTGEPIAAGTADGPEVHTYTVTVQFTVDAEAVTFENTDCTLGEEETGTGL
uniref:DUF7933 domain-containing protein n=2 Tax=Desertimonas flava TaxID=2064846 RepID=UPI0023F322BC